MLVDIGWTLLRTVAPSIGAVSLGELKDHLRVTHDTEDDDIASLGLAAEEAVEAELSRALITQTWVLTLDRFPCWEIRLPRPPLQSVTQVQYVDEAGITQVLSSSTYVVDLNASPGRIYPAYEETWPSTRSQPNAVIVTYKAGKDSAADVPELVKWGVKQTVADMYQNRERSAVEAVQQIEMFERLLSNYRCVTEFNYR